MNEPIPRRRRHPHHVCIDCGVEWDGITAAPVAGEGLDARIMALETRVMSPRGRVRGQTVWVRRADVLALAANQPVAEERT